MTKFKIFFGNLGDIRADRKLNEWLDDHPNAVLYGWQYQQARMGDHSICIEYEESKED